LVEFSEVRSVDAKESLDFVTKVGETPMVISSSAVLVISD
jgi:hypothetical protein